MGSVMDFFYLYAEIRTDLTVYSDGADKSRS